jgi:hypothetical protein
MREREVMSFDVGEVVARANRHATRVAHVLS